ncbi:MAG: hypothetical protein AAF927_32735 [Bacteroidota bacterium]
MGRRLRTAYGFLQLLSIDVILGALLSGMMLTRLLAVQMPHYWYWVLPLSVWVIYTTDHLIDARRLKENAHTPRHLFHYRYFHQIGLVWALGIAVCTLYVPFIISKPILYFGFAMGALVLGHLALVWLIGNRIAWFIHKELGVGLIYAAGVWGAPLVLYESPITSWIISAAVQFFLLALLNLLIFSFYERETDALDQHTSFVRALGEKRTRYLIVLLTAVILALGIWGSFEHGLAPFYLIVQAVYALMLAVLLWVFFDEKRFRFAERYRLWGDAVFLFPLLSLLL